MDNELECMEPYLTHGAQFVKLNNQKSDEQTIKRGILQGSILASHFSLIYINDIIKIENNNTKLTLFADDTAINMHSKKEEVIRKQIIKLNLRSLSMY